MKSPFKRLLSLCLCLTLVLVLCPTSRAEVAADDPLKYLSYTISDGAVTITGCDRSASGILEIPDTIKGNPVEIIDSHAFAGVSLTKLIIPASVNCIKSHGLCNDFYFQEIEFLGDPPTFDNYAFGEYSTYNAPWMGIICWFSGTVYYPTHNQDWIHFAKSGYGGNFDWKAIHNRDDGKQIADPTCDTDGSYQYTCLTCGEIETETIPALGHSWDGGTSISSATCTTDGIVSYVCNTCSEIKINTTPALGHSWDNGTVTTQPTCTEAGVRCYTCQTCSETKEQAISATGHSWGETVVVGTPNCLEAVTVDHICTQCGTVGNRQTLTAPGHSYESTIEAATCTQPGRIIYTCKTCGDVRSTEISPAIGHQFEGGSCIHCGEPEAVSLPGDVNGDGKVNIMDVAKLYAHIKGTLLIEDETQLRQADLTGDGNVNILDIAKLYASVKGTE